MVVRFNNNNNSEWMQMLFDKINNGSSFGIIRNIVNIVERFIITKTSKTKTHTI